MLAAIAIASGEDIDTIRISAEKLEGRIWGDYNWNNATKLMQEFIDNSVATEFDKFGEKYWGQVSKVQDYETKREILKKLALDMSVTKIPTKGRGFLAIQFLDTNNSHIVYYQDGWIYDSGLDDKKPVGNWTGGLGDLNGKIIWRGEIK